MAEEVAPPVDTGNEAPAPESGLPSEVAEQAEVNENLNVIPERWNNAQEMADHIKNMEDKYANLKREQTDTEKKTTAEIEATAKEIETQNAQSALIQDLIPEFMDNDMQLTEDMKAKLIEAGISEEKIELGAYKLRETQAVHHEYVGGKENYDIIMEHHAENFSDEEKKAFNHSIKDPMHSKALLVGLRAMYEADIANGGGEKAQVPQDRFRGETNTTTSVVGYSTRQELMADKKYVDSPVGKRDSGAQAKYRQRLALTDAGVYS